jgi:hypothetical protein
MLSLFLQLGRVLTLALVFSLTATAPPAQTEQPADSAKLVAQLLKSWKERQASVQSYDFQMTGTEFVAQKKITEQALAAAGQATDAEPFTLPETSFLVKMRLTADASGRVRFDHQGQEWSAKNKNYVPESDTDLYDGHVRKVFFEQGHMEFPNAHISTGNASSQTGDVRVLPLMMVYRPLDGSAAGFDPAQLKLANGTGIAEGRECLILQSGESTIWVDAERDFLPTRYYMVRRGKRIRSIEIRYAADAEQRWVPVGWTNARFDGLGQLMESVTVTVAEYHLNTPIPEGTFDIQYPPGTWVHNYITDKEYIIRDGNKDRPIQPGEFDGKNYDQLLHSELPGQTSRNWWFFTILGVNLALLIGIFFSVYYRYRRRRQKRT